jgi:hypothetical protein
MNKFYYWLRIVIGLSCIVAFIYLGFLTYFISSTGHKIDYWGRELFEAPFFFRYIGLEYYAGIGWFLFDILIAGLLSFVAQLCLRQD